MPQFEVEIEEQLWLYKDGEYAMKFCVQDVNGPHVKLYFEIRLRKADGSYMFTAKPYMWDAEVLTPFEFDVSDAGEPENVLSITVTEFREGRVSLDVIPPTRWDVIPMREHPEAE